MDMPRPASYDASDYLGMVRRHWWIVLAFILAGVLGATAGASTQPKEYESTASVLVQALSSQDANATNGRTSSTINLDTEAQLVTSTDVATAAGQLLKVTTPATRWPGRPGQRAGEHHGARHHLRAPTAKQAQAGAHGFAEAYLAARQSAAQADITAQIAALDVKVKQYQGSLTQISSRLATLPINDPNRAALSSPGQHPDQPDQHPHHPAEQLATTTSAPAGSSATRHCRSSPVRPSVPLFAASGALLGLLFGVAVAAVRQRTDRRVRRAADLTRRADVPVLAELPSRTQIRYDDVFPPFGPAGRMFNRLRNEALASCAPTTR